MSFKIFKINIKFILFNNFLLILSFIILLFSVFFYKQALFLYIVSKKILSIQFYIYIYDIIFILNIYRRDTLNEKTLIFHNDCRLNNRCAKYKTCPIILVHKLLSGKWKILILWYLSNETLRFSELKKKLPDTTQKMLTNQLRSLEEDNLIFRKVYPVVPPKVEYGLTDMGKNLIPLLESMYSFGVEYLNEKI